MMGRLPLNGTKTHPLSEHAISVLRRIAGRGVVKPYQVNPGVRNRLFREDLIVECECRGATWLKITEAGRAALQSKDTSHD